MPQSVAPRVAPINRSFFLESPMVIFGINKKTIKIIIFFFKKYSFFENYLCILDNFLSLRIKGAAASARVAHADDSVVLA